MGGSTPQGSGVTGGADGGQGVSGARNRHRAARHMAQGLPVPRAGQGTAATRQYVTQKDISFYLPAAAPGHNPPTFNLYSTTHVSFPASDYFLSSNYCGDKME